MYIVYFESLPKFYPLLQKLKINRILYPYPCTSVFLIEQYKSFYCYFQFQSIYNPEEKYK